MWPFSSKVTIKDSGLLQGFTDYHCHLLPGVDDGVQKTDETLRILQLWEDLGVASVWLTPHIMDDIPNDPAQLQRHFDNLLAHYKGHIRLHLAAENMMDDLFASRRKQLNLLALGESGNHLLVETSYFNPPYGMADILHDVKHMGFFPVLAHPERYQYMNIGDYEKLKHNGILFQLNLPSIVGAYGKAVQRKAEMLLDKGFYDLCGTDTHSLRFYNYFLSQPVTKQRIGKIGRIIAGQHL